MIRAMVMAALLLVGGCATVRENWNCATAAKAKAAARRTIDTLDRLCPAPVDAEPPPG